MKGVKQLVNELMLKRAVNGNPEAFEQLVTPLEKTIWRLCFHMMGNLHDAEEALQTTMIKAWEKIGSFRGESSFETWLYRIGINSCTDMLRRIDREQKRVALQESDVSADSPEHQKADSVTPETQIIRKEEMETVQAALDRLSSEQRVSLILYAVEDKSYQEISEETEVSVGTVKSRIARAREKMREYVLGQ